jgi:hypothetical protein
MGHVVMENGHGLAVGARLTQATGRAERETAIELLEDIPRRRRITFVLVPEQVPGRRPPSPTGAAEDRLTLMGRFSVAC